MKMCSKVNTYARAASPPQSRTTVSWAVRSLCVQKSKYNMKYHIRKQLQRFDLTEDQKRLVVMRTRQAERIWYNLYQRKLIKLDFILSKIFICMGIPEQAQRCASIKEKTRFEYEQLWETIVDLIQGW